MVAEQADRVIADPLGHDMHRHPAIKQQRGMGAAEMVKSEISKIEPLGPPCKLLAEIPGIARGREREVLARAGHGREDQSVIGQVPHGVMPPAAFLCLRLPCAPWKYRANSAYNPLWSS